MARARPKPRLALILALIIYLGFSWAMGVHTAGPQFDEIVSFRGAANSVWGTLRPPCPVESFAFAHRCWPLMVAWYVGAPKDYVFLPTFALLGVKTSIARMGAAILACIGICGVWVFLRAACGWRAAAIGCVLLAINPSYLDMPLFDNGNIAFSLAAAGMLLACLGLMHRGISARLMFVTGLAAGLGTWARLNFAWLPVVGLLAAAVVYRRDILRIARFVPALAAGALCGAIPLLYYVKQNSQELFAFVRKSSVAMDFHSRLTYLLTLLRDVFFAAGEHRTIWGGAATPYWVSLTAALTVLVAAVWTAIFVRARALRALALAALLVAGYFVYTRLPLAQHHLVILVLLAAPLVAAAGVDVARRSRYGGFALAAFALAYCFGAVRHDIVTAHELRATGGLGEWSSAVGDVATFASTTAPRPVYDLDWGLQQPLWLDSRGRLRAQEIYSSGSVADAARENRWTRALDGGGLFVTFANRYLHFPETTIDFRERLDCLHRAYETHEFRQRDGALLAVAYAVPPATSAAPGAGACAAGSDVIFFADPNPAPAGRNAGLAQTTLLFMARRARYVEIRVGAPDGTIVSRSGSTQAYVSGVATTGEWVADGMTFYLQDRTNGKPLTPDNTLGVVRVAVKKAR